MAGVLGGPRGWGCKFVYPPILGFVGISAFGMCKGCIKLEIMGNC